MTKWRDLFTDRQLVALTTFSDLICEARERIRLDAVAAGLPDDGVPLREGGTGADAYAEAVGGVSRNCAQPNDRYLQLLLQMGSVKDSSS